MRAPWVELSRPGAARGKSVSPSRRPLAAAAGAAAAAALLTFAVAFGLADAARAADANGAAPSFSCSRPSEVEAAVCGDPDLAAADRRLTALYAKAKPGALGGGSNQVAIQRRWLATRDHDCAAGAWKTSRYASLGACVAAEYRSRLEALAIATLFDDPKGSLDELRLVQPKAAPIYEALLAYATIDEGGERALRVEALLTPIYAQMEDDERTGFETSGGVGASAHDAAASDAGFARFFDMQSLFGPVDLAWPCAALLKRPGLLQGLGAFWGGALDERVPDSDCEAALPPAPKVEALEKQALAAQPPCEGTIRFSTGRDFAMLGDAVLLHRTDAWTGAHPVKPGKDARAWLAHHGPAVSEAAAELATYYETSFRIASAQAKSDGLRAIDAIAGSAFSLCE